MSLSMISSQCSAHINFRLHWSTKTKSKMSVMKKLKILRRDGHNSLRQRGGINHESIKKNIQRKNPQVIKYKSNLKNEHNHKRLWIFFGS